MGQALSSAFLIENLAGFADRLAEVISIAITCGFASFGRGANDKAPKVG
jgi:hypothetical protein